METVETFLTWMIVLGIGLMVVGLIVMRLQKRNGGGGD